MRVQVNCIIVYTVSGIVPPSGFHVLPRAPPSEVHVQPSCSTYPIDCRNYDTCSPGSHKMKASDHSICVVPATAVEILLTLAQFISSTPCYVSKLQLFFFWLDRTERATDRGACMCSRASCLGLGEPGDRGMERSKRKSPLQIVPILPGTGKRRFAGDFRLDRSIPRSPGSGLQQRHSGQ